MSCIAAALKQLSTDARIPASDRRDFADYAATWDARDPAAKKQAALGALKRLGAHFERAAVAMDGGDPDADPFAIEAQAHGLYQACASEIDSTCAMNAWCNDTCFCGTH
jgi:hypothetical protein